MFNSIVLSEFSFFFISSNIIIIIIVICITTTTTTTIIIIIEFSHQRQLMVFRWSMSDNTSPQISRTLLSILVDCSSAVFWMVSMLPLISRFSSLFSKLFVTVPSARTTIGITFTLMFHSLFNSLARSRYLSLFFYFPSASPFDLLGPQSPPVDAFSFVNQHQVWSPGWDRVIRLYLEVPENFSFSRKDSGLCIYHFFVSSKFNFLHNSHWITFPTQSCLALYSCCASLLYS